VWQHDEKHRYSSKRGTVVLGSKPAALCSGSLSLLSVGIDGIWSKPIRACDLIHRLISQMCSTNFTYTTDANLAIYKSISIKLCQLFISIKMSPNAMKKVLCCAKGTCLLAPPPHAFVVTGYRNLHTADKHVHTHQHTHNS